MSRAAKIGLGILIAIPVIIFFVMTWDAWEPPLEALLTPKRNGMVIINSPTIYTRQRLVNDRLSQTAWLNDQLKVTTEKSNVPFLTIDLVSNGTNNSKTAFTGTNSQTDSQRTSGAGSTAGQTIDGTAKEQSAKPNSSDVDVTPTTADLFRAKNAYREEVRAEMMEAQLDDRHDIDGNTIHRLAFNATVIPGTRLDELAVIKVTLSHDPDLTHDPQIAGEYNKLYEDWLRSMQLTVDKAIDPIVTKVLFRHLDQRLTISLPRFILKRVCELLFDPKNPRFRRISETSCVPTAAAAANPDSLISKANTIISEFAVKYLQFRKAVQTSIGEANISWAKKQQKPKGSFQSIALDRVCDQALLNFALANVPPDQNKGGSVSSDPRPGPPVSATGSGQIKDASAPASQNDGSAVPGQNKTSNSLDQNNSLFQGQNVLSAVSGQLIQTRDIATGEHLTIECPTFDGPSEKIVAGLYLYNRLFARVAADKSSPDDIVAAITSDLDKNCKKITPACNLPELTTSELRCAAADYMREYLDFFGDPPAGRDPLQRYLSMQFLGPDTGSCSILITNAPRRPNVKTGLEILRDKLNRDIELYSYAITPKNLVQHVSTTLDTRNTIQALVGARKEELDSVVETLREKSKYNRAIEANPIVLGFGLANERQAADPNSSAPYSSNHLTEFGWIIAPQTRVGSDMRAQVDGQYGLSAVVSLPAWWPAVRLVIKTCWISRSSLHLYQPKYLCSEDTPSAPAKAPVRTIVRLPVSILELSHKLAFEVVQEPHIIQSTTPQFPFHLTVGEPADLLIRGSRLWRSTEVTLGSQRANEIVVLPDMDGIIAKFRCVGMQKAVKGPNLEVKVFTSEGEAEPEFALLEPGGKQCPTDSPGKRSDGQPSPTIQQPTAK